MLRRPPRSTRTDTLFPSPTLFRSQVILASISSPRNLPLSLDCPRWGELRLYTERIYDGILNGELPFGRDGIPTHDTELIDSLDLTVRHVDLKSWMRQHYPQQRPGFLFSRSAWTGRETCRARV